MNDLQREILNIYKEVKKILDKNNIRYFAVGGTAIGAVREHGFLSWDDDFDLLIPDIEINKFLAACKKELPSHLKIFSYKDSKHAIMYFYKIHNVNTTFLESATCKYKDYRYGVFIDIKPLYGLPDDEKEICKYNSKCTLYRALDECVKCEYEQLPFKQKLLKVLLKPMNLFVSNYYWRDKLEKYQSKYTFDESNNVGLAFGYLNDKLIYKKEWFSDYVDMPFEDTTVRCCKDYDKYLTKQHGDYMTPPKKEEMVSHHNQVIVDLNHSYLDYDDNLKLTKEDGKKI